MRPLKYHHTNTLNSLAGWRGPVDPVFGESGDFAELRGLYRDYYVRGTDHQQNWNQVGLHLGCLDNAVGWVWLLRQCQIWRRRLLARC